VSNQQKPLVFVPLDYPDADSALAMFHKLHPVNPHFKIGLELFVSAGPEFVRKLSSLGAEIFLDLKFHDIPNTVAGAVRAATRLGVQYMNVHCGGGSSMMEAALRARDEEAAKLSLKRKPSLLGVTVLTSLDDQAVQEIGFPRSSSQQVKHFVDLARDAGLDGVVCSAHELPLVQQVAGKDFVTMIPGIRPAWSSADDQKRIMTPKEASLAGAHCLVVGRPITAAPNPAEALGKVLGEL
jgi:orotidine-5'-phosphate decarboxylase